ncbi:helix-turn-helix domain-containing protein [Amycolatopsis camponoti]|uniref:helix-turn-helix domain-containing protein n=1 Tax=Amycolatopsis camponoti TaxID=2606593 RepID=UPI0012D72E9B|nr:helix-turn-helix transcriptional regulator [Amycolatopsis camponoti]
MPNRASRETSRYRLPAERLAAILKAARQDLGLSQQQLAQAAGVAIGTVRALEGHRTVEPGFFTVLALAQALRIDAVDLIETSGTASTEAAARTDS